MAGISRVITFANGKGGVGKTSCAVNVAGLSAAAGWKVLFIDLDPQGNAGHDLGYSWPDANGHIASDNGERLVTSLTTGTPLAPVIENARPNLDVISGGEHLDDLEDVLAGRARRGSDGRGMLVEALRPVAEQYDLIVIDTPPTRPVLLQLALAATQWMVVPTRSDRGSIEGLRTLANQVVRARETNELIGVLGAVLFDTGTTATRIRSDAAEDITAVLGGAAQVFSAVIRHSESVAVDAREKGQLVHEIAERVQDAEPYWVALKEGRRPSRTPGSAPALAEDYVLLTQEILQRMADHEEAATA